MDQVEAAVAGHYARGDMRDAIARAMERAGIAADALTQEDLAWLDHFHIGGRAATGEVLDLLDLRSGRRLLDVGSGIGGPARLAASERGCEVIGVDLTPEFVDVAAWLTSLTGPAGLVRFVAASAADLPLEDASVDAAMMLHVGMNLPDKPAVFREVRRVVRPGGRFAVFDLMATGDPAGLDFPLPWASAPEESFVEAPEDYRAALAGAGFRVVQERARREMAVAFFTAMRERPPETPLNQGALADDLPERLMRAGRAVLAGTVTPVEMVGEVR